MNARHNRLCCMLCCCRQLAIQSRHRLNPGRKVSEGFSARLSPFHGRYFRQLSQAGGKI